MDEAQLLELAKQAFGNAYAPYSNFPVGAAVLAADGRAFTGANVENASYGLSICAERCAVFNAAQSGARALKALAIYTPTPEPVSPCGACRQVLSEFGEDILVVSGCSLGEVRRWNLRDLLPDSFGLGTQR